MFASNFVMPMFFDFVDEKPASFQIPLNFLVQNLRLVVVVVVVFRI